jgi:hypothetical protein
MKIKTFTDKRNLWQKTGMLPEDVANRPFIHTVSKTEQAEREKRKLPEPRHHYFDIEVTPRDGDKPPEILFCEQLFLFYWQFKHERLTGELWHNFTVRNFCRHHEVSKTDLPSIITASYELRQYIQKAFEVDKYRPEVLQQIELHLKNNAHSAKQADSLPDIFRDVEEFERIIKIVCANGFAVKKGSQYHWTGAKINSASRGKGRQLVGLSEVCRKYYKRDKLTAKELNHLWTKFFNYKMSANNWQPQQAINFLDFYTAIFDFIK